MANESFDSLKDILVYHSSLQSMLKPTLDKIKPTFEMTSPLRATIEANQFTDSIRDIIEPSIKINESILTNLKKTLSFTDTIPKIKYNFPSVELVKSIPKMDYNIPIVKIDYSNHFPSIVDALPKLDNSYITDFRINVLSQSVFQKQELLFKQINNASDPVIDEFNIEFDEFISETIAYATKQDNQKNDIADIKRMVFQIYESQEHLKETVHEKLENHKNKEPIEPSSENSVNHLNSFLIAFFTVLSFISIPKDVYESLVWYIDVLNYLIKIFTKN